jgi:hypothetical protein
MLLLFRATAGALPVQLLCLQHCKINCHVLCLQHGVMRWRRFVGVRPHEGSCRRPPRPLRQPVAFTQALVSGIC